MIKAFFVLSCGAAVLFFMLFIISAIRSRRKNKKPEQDLRSRLNKMTNTRKRTAVSLIVFLSVLLFLQNVVFAMISCILYAYFDWYIKNKRSVERAALIDKQVVEALTVIKNAVQSGQSLAQAVATAAGELREPVKNEFERMSESLALGAGFDKVLNEASENSPSKEFGLMIDTIRISKDTGASLSGIFDRVTDSASQRIAIRAKVAALTSQGRMSGNIVSIIPFFVILMMYVIEPGMMSSLFTTLIGNILLLVVVVMVLTGSFVIRKMTEIKF